jgi:hypothetical protein
MKHTLRGRLSLLLPRCSFLASCLVFRLATRRSWINVVKAPARTRASRAASDSPALELFSLSRLLLLAFGEIGRQTFDGRGNTDGTATLSANGNIVKGVTVQGI